MKKLTIAIPTFNRASNLFETLDSLSLEDCINDIYIYIR